MGVNLEGHKERLGLWLSANEGAKFRLGILTELQNRGLKDILIACVDGLKGFSDAIQAVYPQTHIQLCIVPMVRHSMKLVCWKAYKAVATDLKRTRIQLASAIVGLIPNITSLGVLKPKHFLGRLFSLFMMHFASLSVKLSKHAPFGAY